MLHWPIASMQGLDLYNNFHVIGYSCFWRELSFDGGHHRAEHGHLVAEQAWTMLYTITSLIVLTLLFSTTSGFSVKLDQRPNSISGPSVSQQTIMDEQRNRQEAVSFSHVHLYVDKLEDLSVYKALEDELNAFALEASSLDSLESKRQLWLDMTKRDAMDFVSHGRDVVKQLLAGFGFRVTAARYQADSRTVMVTSPDPCGVQIVVTAVAPSGGAVHGDTMKLYAADNVIHFMSEHAGRQGIATLGFLADDVKRIHDKYQALHPSLVAQFDTENDVLEVYAYYLEHANDVAANAPKVADKGTALRFVQRKEEAMQLPGLEPVPATFGQETQAAYCDHWVSNVFSRTEFLDTLHDTLGFSPKVDFNAGVVAAGEAQIESTVTGNDSTLATNDERIALRDQSQVYLPINNALSEVGHVHGFLAEYGQGIQHLASRVDDLVGFVQRGNDNRKIFGEGFSFLQIPRSYYGILTTAQLTEGMQGDGLGAVSSECAEAILEVLRTSGIVSVNDDVDLEASREAVDAALSAGLKCDHLNEYTTQKDGVLATIARSRYMNLYSLLRGHLSEESYLAIVRNQILVDIQGGDLLYQIFTSNILQRNPNDEAPFFEFIQRVCSECMDENGCPQKIRPGCGGFGIRNFLTLFLSIEVTKAIRAAAKAKAAGDMDEFVYAQKMVDYLTDQLNESNPILTEISDAMTEEGICRDKIVELMAEGNEEEASLWASKMGDAALRKKIGNDKLMACNARYNNLMKNHREKRNASRQH